MDCGVEREILFPVVVSFFFALNWVKEIVKCPFDVHTWMLLTALEFNVIICLSVCGDVERVEEFSMEAF